jgi:hypothetical protein
MYSGNGLEILRMIPYKAFTATAAGGLDTRDLLGLLLDTSRQKSSPAGKNQTHGSTEKRQPRQVRTSA